MAPNNSKKLIIEERRREVAALRRRGMTFRQIHKAMEIAGRQNEDNGQPWSLKTIFDDVTALQAAARAEAVKDISEHKAEVLAHYQELINLAWREKRYDDVRLVLKDVRALLGTDSPQVIVFEQVQARMVEALSSLEREFADDPATLDRALSALVGRPGGVQTNTRSVN